MTARLVGVLGGAGPGATAYFLQRLVARTEARCDQEHIRTLAFNDTAIPDRTDFLLGRSARSPLDALVEDGQLLAACGCDLLALPCNTAHSFFDELQRQVPVPVVHMVRETVERARALGVRRLGVLGTLGTVASRVYAAEAERAGLECAYPGPATQHEVSRIIFDEVKAGRAVDPATLERLTASLEALGCDAAVLACTELSLAFGQATRTATTIPVVDALDVLADAVIERTGHRRREEPCAVS
ncbi:amino acid racemase [uncultured Adlercreutzia sp.]|uniref:aspartate/glutamate racemase family protein n=1 Tax=uncultured Adlercreutzia sp. TaxID=875803 RepID=UPI0026008629|nr:amino acid racemase [uncultured Adlercreutzia sp.]